MKPSSQLVKSTSATSTPKPRKILKERRKFHGASSENSTHHIPSEKGSPSKESNSRQYAGIDAESLSIYAEQSAFEHISEDIANTLTEDINYKLRYIVNDALLKARLSGRNSISSSDLEQSFVGLNIDRVYGAASNPNWVPFGYQNLSYLDDNQINLVHLAEEELTYIAPCDTVIKKTWLPVKQELGKPLKNYFVTMCQMVVNKDVEVRNFALNNIRCNARIGPIIQWFYNFGYILLSKDITYDCLTLYALDLLRILEISPMSRLVVSEKQLKLLIRLLLQRLLKSATTSEVLRPMCSVLALLCTRQPLRDFVISKMVQKLAEICQTYALSVITIGNSLGIDAITQTFLPNMNLFLTRVMQRREPALTSALLELYYIVLQQGLVDMTIYSAFYEAFGDALVLYPNFAKYEVQVPDKIEMNFTKMKWQLLKTRRKFDPTTKSKTQTPVDKVFDMPPENSKIMQKVRSYRYQQPPNYVTYSSVIIGKTSVLLPVLKQKETLICSPDCDSSLLIYNL